MSNSDPAGSIHGTTVFPLRPKQMTIRLRGTAFLADNASVAPDGKITTLAASTPLVTRTPLIA